jgi:hypothetical protein
LTSKIQKIARLTANQSLSKVSKSIFLGHITLLWGDVNTLRAGPTLVYFRLDRLQRVSTYVQQMWGIIGHVTVEAGSPVGTDGAPPQVPPKLCGGRLRG